MWCIFVNYFLGSFWKLRPFWAFLFLCSVTMEYLIFFSCILITEQVTHLSSLPRDSTEYATSFWVWSGVSLDCFPQASSASQFAVGFSGKRAFQIFPVTPPHVLCASVGTNLSRPCGGCEVATRVPGWVLCVETQPCSAYYATCLGSSHSLEEYFFPNSCRDSAWATGCSVSSYVFSWEKCLVSWKKVIMNFRTCQAFHLTANPEILVQFSWITDDSLVTCYKVFRVFFKVTKAKKW